MSQAHLRRQRTFSHTSRNLDVLKEPQQQQHQAGPASAPAGVRMNNTNGHFHWEIWEQDHNKPRLKDTQSLLRRQRPTRKTKYNRKVENTQSGEVRQALWNKNGRKTKQRSSGVKVTNTELNSDQTGLDRIGSDRTEPDRTGSGQTGSDWTRPDRTGSDRC
uniref:Uncharacterized protein n=1 Tax=Nothobranchius pienaari TaxID=704102 RepID=A0A1A8LCQ3_9TELE